MHAYNGIWGFRDTIREIYFTQSWAHSLLNPIKLLYVQPSFMILRECDDQIHLKMYLKKRKKMKNGKEKVELI